MSFATSSPRDGPRRSSSGIRALALMKPQPTSRRARATRIPRDPVGEVIIVRRDPRIAFRVVENQMNYAYLGDRLSQSAADNFPVFLADLCARADAAYITPSTRSLLETAETRRVRIPQLAGPARLRDPPLALELVPPRPRRPIADSADPDERDPDSDDRSRHGRRRSTTCETPAESTTDASRRLDAPRAMVIGQHDRERFFSIVRIVLLDLEPRR